MLACLSNICRLFLSTRVTPNMAWNQYMARLLDNVFKNKIDRFTISDGDRQIRFESIFTILLLHSNNLLAIYLVQ